MRSMKEHRTFNFDSLVSDNSTVASVTVQDNCSNLINSHTSNLGNTKAFAADPSQKEKKGFLS